MSLDEERVTIKTWTEFKVNQIFGNAVLQCWIFFSNFDVICKFKSANLKFKYKKSSKKKI